MSELRIKLLELAIQGGATIDNAERVASDWENWAAADAHPLRLCTPSPKSCGHEFEWDCLMAGCECAPKPIDPEIDWSRPQLVKSKKYEATGDWAFVVKTTGAHTEGYFHGVAQFSDKSAVWAKKDFEYHGEIPAEKKAEIGPSLAEALDAARVSTLENAHGKRIQVVMMGEISDELKRNLSNSLTNEELLDEGWKVISK